jgi:GT2 family glycosyltransferase
MTMAVPQPPRRLVAVVTAYNRADFVRRCVDSILEAADADLAVRVLVMDNGSTDGTGEAAQAAGDRVTVMRTEDNRPVVGVINRGLEAALADPAVDYIVYMNEDTQYTPGSLRRLVEACAAHPHAFLTPLQLNYREPQHLDDNAFGHAVQVRALIEDAVMGRPLQTAYPLPTIIGAAIIATRSTWERVGLLDQNFWFYGVDDDLATRAHHLGYGVLLVPGAQLLHAHGKLGARQDAEDKPGILRRWRNELQARYLFLLKNPDRSLARGTVSACHLALTTFLTCLRWGWPVGALHAWGILAHCLRRLGAIAEARRRDFDPARRAPQ